MKLLSFVLFVVSVFFLFCSCILSNLLKALLHWAIYRATSLATFKSVALQLHEQGCYTAVQWHCQQLTKLWPRRTEERIIRILIGWLSNARLELWKVESSFTFCNACKKLRDKLLSRCVTLGNIWWNLRRDKIARQIAWKISQCNTAFS